MKLPMFVVRWLARRAIENSTDYTHLKGYMMRYHVVPMENAGTASMIGCGPVDWKKRPFARLLQKLGIAMRLHLIISSDRPRRAGIGKPDFHDHPWNFITIILDGGYIEHRPGREPKFYGPGSVLFRRAEDLHHLELVRNSHGEIPAMTLFTTFPYKQKWGFLMPDGKKMPYNEYFSKFEDLYTKEQK